MKVNQFLMTTMLAAACAVWAPAGPAAAQGRQTTASPAPGKVAHDARYERAREQLIDILAAEDYEKVNVSAATFGNAMALLQLGVDTYLEGSVGPLGSIDKAREYGAAILQGLEDAKVKYDDYGGADLVGGLSLEVRTDAEARELGEMMAQVAGLLAESRAGHGASLRSASRRVFEALKVIPGTGQSLVTQYVGQLQSLSKSDRREMIRWMRD